jgi:NADH dehydrogenase [ubiquinone] 1 alpha subcomplex assembly factor 6
MVTIPGYVNRLRNKTPAPSQRSAAAEPLSSVAALVRRHDGDRFRTALFAPAARREALFALYAFNYEIARVRETVTEPTLGRIRLEWWRENIAAAYRDDVPRHHPVIEELTAAIRGNTLTRLHFDRLIDARETDLDEGPRASLDALEGYAEDTSARLIYLALETLGVRGEPAHEAGHHVGIAYSLSGLLRAMPILKAATRPIIPVDIAARNQLDMTDAQPLRRSPALCSAVAEIAAAAEAHLRSARAMRKYVPRRAVPALLPGAIADWSLRRLRRAAYDPFDADLASSTPLQTWRLLATALLNRI